MASIHSSRTRRLLWTALLGLLSVGLLASTAWANSAAHWKRAQTLFKEGRAQVLKKNYAAALKSYDAAIFAIDLARKQAPTPALKQRYGRARKSMLYVVGRTYQIANKPIKAYKLYQKCLAAEPPARLRKLVEGFSTKLAAQIFPILSVKTQPSGASLSILDAKGKTHKVKTPFERQLPPGTVQIELSHEGYQPVKASLTLDFKRKTMRTYYLKKKSALIRQPPPPPRDPPKPQQGSWMGVAFWASAGLAVVGVGVGIALLAVGIPQEQRGLDCYGNVTNAACRQRGNDAIAADVESGQTFKGLGITLMIVAGLATASALTFFFLQPKKPTPTQSSVSSAQRPQQSPQAPPSALTLTIAQ